MLVIVKNVSCDVVVGMTKGTSGQTGDKSVSGRELFLAQANIAFSDTAVFRSSN